MFGFLADIGTYDTRKVGRFESDGILVSTAEVSDGARPFETAIIHPRYRGGEMIIVEAYFTKDEAKDGHKKWVATMTGENLPPKLTDCCNAEVGQMVKSLGGQTEFLIDTTTDEGE